MPISNSLLKRSVSFVVDISSRTLAKPLTWQPRISGFQTCELFPPLNNHIAASLARSAPRFGCLSYERNVGSLGRKVRGSSLSLAPVAASFDRGNLGVGQPSR
jgi:hypothetical protein